MISHMAPTAVPRKFDPFYFYTISIKDGNRVYWCDLVRNV